MALYTKAAEILDKVEKQQGALKTLVYESKSANIKQLFALVCEAQKFSPILEEIIVSTKLLKHTKLKMPLAKVCKGSFIFAVVKGVSVCSSQGYNNFRMCFMIAS